MIESKTRHDTVYVGRCPVCSEFLEQSYKLDDARGILAKHLMQFGHLNGCIEEYEQETTTNYTLRKPD